MRLKILPHFQEKIIGFIAWFRLFCKDPAAHTASGEDWGAYLQVFKSQITLVTSHAQKCIPPGFHPPQDSRFLFRHGSYPDR